MLNVPDYLKEIIAKQYSEGMLRTINLITPSGQFWNGLSPAQQEKWREIISGLGEDPENYLAHMRRMLPSNPPGKE